MTGCVHKGHINHFPVFGASTSSPNSGSCQLTASLTDPPGQWAVPLTEVSAQCTARGLVIQKLDSGHKDGR